MSVHRYQGEGPLIIGEEDPYLDSRFHQMSLEGSSTAWMTPEQRSPLSSSYPIPSPSLSGTLTPGVFNAEQDGRVPRFMIQDPGNGSLLSPYLRPSPAFGQQTPPWGIFNATSYGPGAIGQERNSALSPFNSLHQPPQIFWRPGGRHVREHSGGHHNVVDVARIRQGADVRTTVYCSAILWCILGLTMNRLCYGTSQTRLIRYITLPEIESITEQA